MSANGIYQSLLGYNNVFKVSVVFDTMFNVLKLFSQTTNPQTYTSFILILFWTKITCGIFSCTFWWLVNNLYSWFLYGKKIYIFIAIICSQLHLPVIIPMDGFIKVFIVYSRRFPLPIRRLGDLSYAHSN